MVTHDRHLINQTANYISELSPETLKLTHFHGNYQNYLREKEWEYQRLKQIREQQENTKKILNFIKQNSSPESFKKTLLLQKWIYDQIQKYN